ncbi:SDR family oxidoreductase [Bradyrhizobium sp. BR13661]|jgi:NAD(P)-dependent dehydrogenase (short-subunit alcohol dehydrogenase family)|uniref:SDR family oxidoreductase n=1 Tax=Bradyrhizobium sp. BR13661 TaxID=2940622 RepID=UPI002473DA55|nr:SDR family oxidoreductase [Bradyrhizobium sp. BR13661]MDH6259492.1 NAD(P)-dependent dehydrogenase (short-subunit alcohol dehydrogenase family) [Bradyrhizobium sp. BR13661]
MSSNNPNRVSAAKPQRMVIVGGSSGIGRATAEAAVAASLAVTLVARDARKLVRVADELGGVPWASVDMTNAVAVAEWAEALDPFDHLVITAASSSHGRFAEMPLSDVRRMFDGKFFGPYGVAQACLSRINTGGSITFFSGVLSRRPGLNCSGLGAVEGLTRALALELGPRIRVNCISPGMVRTDVYAGMPEDAREAMFRSTGESLPLGRVGEPGEIANAVLFAATNTFLTGQVLDVDGGHMIRQYATR